uniref:Putative secreted protein n=1 Tax=Anopheles darlingi TaxID=43151 RepID=A0A2M4DB14_ANODA
MSPLGEGIASLCFLAGLTKCDQAICLSTVSKSVTVGGQSVVCRLISKNRLHLSLGEYTPNALCTRDDSE